MSIWPKPSTLTGNRPASAGLAQACFKTFYFSTRCIKGLLPQLPYATSSAAAYSEADIRVPKVEVTKTGGKTFVFRFVLDGQRSYAGIGEFSTVKQSHTPATANRHLTLLSANFRRAVEWGRIDKNPCMGVKMARENSASERLLSEVEIARLLQAMDTGSNRTAVMALAGALIDNLTRPFNRMQKVVGLEKTNIHDLRHTHAGWRGCLDQARQRGAGVACGALRVSAGFFYRA